MKSSELKVSVTVRIPISLVQFLDKEVDEKKYSDRSQAIISLIQSGRHLSKIIELAKDPKKSKEIVKTLKGLENVKQIQEALETLEPHQLKLVESLAVKLNDEKIKQTILDMQE